MIRIRLPNVRCDRARPTPATILIERGIGLIHVRPFRSRRVYTLPLAAVAESIVNRVIKAEVFEARIAKAKARKAKRGAR